MRKKRSSILIAAFGILILIVFAIFLFYHEDGKGKWQAEVNEENICFREGIDDFVEEYNGRYRKEYGEDYLTPPENGLQYVFTEDETIWTLPSLSIQDSEEGYIQRVNLKFDWHSFSGPLMEKYKEMCTYTLSMFFPEFTDAEIEEWCEEIIHAGYDHPVERENENPYAIYYQGKTGVMTRFAMGQKQVISIIPFIDEVCREYERQGVKIVKIKE